MLWPVKSCLNDTYLMTKMPNQFIALVQSLLTVQKVRKSEDIKFPLVPMGVLAPGSAHARPSAQPPIDMSGNFPAPHAKI